MINGNCPNWHERVRLLANALVVAPLSQMGGIFAKAFFRALMILVANHVLSPGFDVDAAMEEEVDQVPVEDQDSQNFETA